MFIKDINIIHGCIMKTFDLKAIPGLDNTMFRVSGSETEKDRLVKYLTVINKSVGYQLNKAKEKLQYWSGQQRQLEKFDKEDGYISGQLMSTRALVKELEEKYKEEYYTYLEEELYIPSGYYYLIKDCQESIWKSKIQPVFLDWMRDYQKEAVTEALKYKRGIIVLPTGAGKSLTILSTCLSFLAIKKRICIIVPTEYLVGQVYDLIKQHHDSVTAAGGGRVPKLGADILITTVQSALKYTADYDCIIGDEIQHASCLTMQNIFLHSERAEYVYGFTATPNRSDGLELGIHAWCGPILYQKNVRWGIEAGWLADPAIFVKNISVKNRKIHEKSLATSAYKHLVGSPEVIEYVIQQLRKAFDSGRKCLVITKTLDIARKLKKAAPDLQLGVADAKYKKPLYDFQKGETNALIATVGLVSEGIDIPTCDYLCILTQHSSLVTTYQSVGRVLRKSPDKKSPIILDVCIKDGYKPFESSAKKRFEEYQKITSNIKILN